MSFNGICVMKGGVLVSRGQQPSVIMKLMETPGSTETTSRLYWLPPRFGTQVGHDLWRHSKGVETHEAERDPPSELDDLPELSDLPLRTSVLDYDSEDVVEQRKRINGTSSSGEDPDIALLPNEGVATPEATGSSLQKDVGRSIAPPSSDDAVVPGETKTATRRRKRSKKKQHASVVTDSPAPSAPEIDSPLPQDESLGEPSSGTLMSDYIEPTSLDVDPMGYGTGPLATIINDNQGSAAVWGSSYPTCEYPVSMYPAQGPPLGPQGQYLPWQVDMWQQANACVPSTGASFGTPFGHFNHPVSYTHLTLPTN